MIVTSELQLYLILKQKLGEEDAQTLVEYFSSIKANEAKKNKAGNLEASLRMEKAASDFKKLERIAAVTIIAVYLIVLALCFIK